MKQLEQQVPYSPVEGSDNSFSTMLETEKRDGC